MNENYLQSIRESANAQYSKKVSRVQEEEDPSHEQVTKAAKSVKKASVQGETPKQTKNFDKKLKKKTPKPKTDPTRDYAKEAQATGTARAAATSAERDAGGGTSPNKAKKRSGPTSTQLTTTKKGITVARVKAGFPSKLVSNKEAAGKIQRQGKISKVAKTEKRGSVNLVSHTEYTRMGLVLAEALGAIAAKAAKVVGKEALKVVVKNKLSKKAKSEEQQPQDEETHNNDYINKLIEAFAGPIAKKYGEERSSKSIRDPKVKADSKEAKAKMEKKLQLAPGSTKPKAQDMVQASMNNRRRKKLKNDTNTPLDKRTSAALTQRENER